MSKVVNRLGLRLLKAAAVSLRGCHSSSRNGRVRLLHGCPPSCFLRYVFIESSWFAAVCFVSVDGVCHVDARVCSWQETYPMDFYKKESGPWSASTLKLKGKKGKEVAISSDPTNVE